ncbi:hypothetical protein CC1G_06575 [Coprinopsis cinerea okayama7|uniref:Uncharacterized protein n=1 Tax=Coprinopsis cinerea (strain Okayama-7 / 130 / ATCC MYA-4618 / FGSC 9003) TaxID=240176 RepID=A8N303_COPC7|nr:hypothetical protein CC1G_06575 [Coprinopsis cinerea okayama7\|eukprot:XP_001829238.2 hypothetical protein CC1G_06575 [Coprinopsis cinerea okayama7\
MHPLCRRALRPQAIWPQRFYATAAQQVETNGPSVSKNEGGSSTQTPEEQRARVKEIVARRRAERLAREQNQTTVKKSPSASPKPTVTTGDAQPQRSLEERLQQVRARLRSIDTEGPGPRKSDDKSAGKPRRKGDRKSSAPEKRPQQSSQRGADIFDKFKGGRDLSHLPTEVESPSHLGPESDISKDLSEILPPFRSRQQDIQSDIRRKGDYSIYLQADPKAYSTPFDKLPIASQVQLVVGNNRGVPPSYKGRVSTLLGGIAENSQRKQ